ncbi:hypothetical protein EFA46_015940 (plasmid) [Halarchaeum sp. CBA1220]|uniref:hypothetical protein n=1 Tax=Halarchaeum sp. CBA1220 TaxID=1853682 RepID=UPI001315018D|nr:hypothetical protein [Halarchaeum sp. CBA1220]QLC35748.1 hypothetical protein EFA46_015940 [Halarchaeum sp. CBA1220]
MHDAVLALSRRGVLKSLGGLATLGAASTPAVATDTETRESASPLPAPFDAVPVIDDPSARKRELARLNYPPHVVPDNGPVPDAFYQYTPTASIVVPEWALAAVRWRLSQHDDPASLERYRVEEILMEYAQVHQRFRTPDGRDAASALLRDVASEADR